MKITGCVTPARRVFARFTLAAKENKRNGAGQAPAGGCSSPHRAACPENSKKVRRGRLNSRRKLRRAFSTLRFIPRRQIGERIDRGSNTEEGIISRRERSRGAKIDHVAMVSPSGTERPGPARPRLSRRRIKKERSGTTKCRLTRPCYLTGQSISLSREIIPGGDDGENHHIFGLDNYPHIYRLYVLRAVSHDNAFIGRRCSFALRKCRIRALSNIDLIVGRKRPMIVLRRSDFKRSLRQA